MPVCLMKSKQTTTAIKLKLMQQLKRDWAWLGLFSGIQSELIKLEFKTLNSVY